MTNLLKVTVLFLAAVLSVDCTAQKSEKMRFSISENKLEKRIDILIDGQPFTSYIYPDALTKPVLYPLRTSRGTLITRGWPMDPRQGERVDHPHHVGMWFNYGDVNGLDFWNSYPDMPADKRNAYGVIKHRRVLRMKSSEVNAELEVELDWEKPDGKVLLKEHTRFVFAGQGDMRTIERVSKLTAVSEDVFFADDKEGLFGIRLSRELEHRSDEPWIFTDSLGRVNKKVATNNEGITGVYRSSEGKSGNDVWGTRGKWVSVDGVISGEPVSVAILDHESNPGYPTYWHARGYGLFAANPLGQRVFSNGERALNFKLVKGKSVTFSYTVLIKSGGPLTEEMLNDEVEGFSR